MDIREWKGKVMRICCIDVRRGPTFNNVHKKCSRYTAFIIDGGYYCRQHAAQYCLKYVLDKKEAL